MKPRPLRAFAISTAAASCALAAGACGEYDPPPEVALVQPTAGFWTKDDPIELTFTESVDPATFVFDVWRGPRDFEGDIPPDAPQLVDGCTLGPSPCTGGLELQFDASRTKATLIQHGAFATVEGKPLIIVVRPNLEDKGGRARKVVTELDFQINPVNVEEPVDIALDSNVLSLSADLSQVVPVWLHMYLDFAVDPATGDTRIVATFAKMVPADPPNYDRVDRFTADMSPNGWTVTFTARINKKEDGSYFMDSDPFDVDIHVLNGQIPVTLTGFRVQGTIWPGGAEGEDLGRDKAEGTLSTTGGSFTIGDEPTPVGPITTPWTGYGFHPEEIPAGIPRTCDSEPCIAMTAAGGDCQIPENWTPPTAGCPASP